jgi:hypothetical protein
MNSQTKGQVKARKMRRSRRVALQVAILVYEPGTENRSVVDDTFAVMVNKHGAMIALSRNVQNGQLLLVINKKTKESKECRVAHIGPTQGEKRWVGIEFTQAAPEFWGISFPPMRPSPVAEPIAKSTPKATAKPSAIL